MVSPPSWPHLNLFTFQIPHFLAQSHFLRALTYESEGDTSIQVGFPGDSVVKNLPASAVDTEDSGSIPGSGRSPGEGNGNPLQYSCLENSKDRGAW